MSPKQKIGYPVLLGVIAAIIGLITRNYWLILPLGVYGWLIWVVAAFSITKKRMEGATTDNWFDRHPRLVALGMINMVLLMSWSYLGLLFKLF